MNPFLSHKNDLDKLEIKVTVYERTFKNMLAPIKTRIAAIYNLCNHIDENGNTTLIEKSKTGSYKLNINTKEKNSSYGFVADSISYECGLCNKIIVKRFDNE